MVGGRATSPLSPLKKVKYRRKGKGLLCCLGGAEFVQFLAALAVLHYDDELNELHQDDLKKRMNSSYS